MPEQLSEVNLLTSSFYHWTTLSYYPCSADVPSGETAWPLRYESRWWNGVDRRDYPLSPRTSPTSQARQETRKHGPGYYINERRSTSRDYGCSPWQYVWVHSLKTIAEKPPFVDVTSISLDWQLRMRLDIKDECVNLGQHLAEYRETASMFRDFAHGARDAWRTWRGRNPSRRRLTTRDVATAELTASWGVAPFVTDVARSVERLDNRLSQDIVRRFTSFDRARGEDEVYTGGVDYHYHWKASERAVCYVQLHPDHRGFTFGNPLEVAWELVPFSVVIDWGINVGAYLSALDALKNVTGVIGTVTRKEKYSHSGTLREYVSADQRTKERPLHPTVYATTSHSRSVVSSIPVPSIPRWEPSRSWRNLVHGVALLRVLNRP